MLRRTKTFFFLNLKRKGLSITPYNQMHAMLCRCCSAFPAEGSCDLNASDDTTEQTGHAMRNERVKCRFGISQKRWAEKEGPWGEETER